MAEPKAKNLSKRVVAMIWLPDAFNEYGRYLFGDVWEDDLWRIGYSSEKMDSLYKDESGTPKIRLERRLTKIINAKNVYRKISGFLSSGELISYMKSSRNDKDFEILAANFWQDEISVDFYDTGTVFGDPSAKYSIGEARKRPARKIFVRREDFEKILLIESNQNNQKSNAGRKHKFNYGQIMSIIIEIYENDEHSSQNQFAERIQEVYQAVYPTDEYDVPSVASLKEQVLKEFSKPRDEIKKYIQENPRTYKK